MRSDPVDGFRLAYDFAAAWPPRPSPPASC